MTITPETVEGDKIPPCPHRTHGVHMGFLGLMPDEFDAQCPTCRSRARAAATPDP